MVFLYVVIFMGRFECNLFFRVLYKFLSWWCFNDKIEMKGLKF